MGRKSIYEEKIKPHLEEIKKAVGKGATLEEIAEAYGVGVSTLYNFKAKYKELQESFACGREEVVIKIKAALLKKAIGFEYEEEKKVGRKDKDGENIVLVERYRRYSPPSETAAAMLLRNYDKDWLDNDQNARELKKQELDLKKAIAEATNFDLDLSEGDDGKKGGK